MTPPGAIPSALPADVARVAAAVLDAVLEACDAGDAVRRHFPTRLDDAASVRVLAFGKASAPMARAAFDRLGRRVSAAVVLTPPQWAGLASHPNARVFPVDHPIPTERNIHASRALAACAARADPDEPVLALVSGGGSAHLTLPRPGVTLDDIRDITGAMLRAGAPIHDLNTVRRSLDRLKGGGLRDLCPSRRISALVVSDVIGDDPATIASGPFTRANPADALAVLDRWGVAATEPVRAAMARIDAATEADEPGAVEHRIILNGPVALAAALEAARTLCLSPDAPTPPMTGEAAPAGARLAARLMTMDADALAGEWGETTVTVTDPAGVGEMAGLAGTGGVGGRCLEVALAAAAALADGPSPRNWAVMTLATDGIDGPTDAAGAVLCSERFADGRAVVLARHALRRHDSYHAVEMLGGLIRTGMTGTNVNDLALAWWR